MIQRAIFICMVMILLGTFVHGQQSLVLSIKPIIGKEELILGKAYIDARGDTILVETLRFYLSNFMLYSKGKSVWQEKNSYHLVEGDDSAKRSIALRIPPKIKYDALGFTWGVDSTANVSGAMGGDLDPTKGMYWTWQNGYINTKIEGTCSSSTAAKGAFQMHLGGYASPFRTDQRLLFSLVEGNTVQINIQLEHFFEQVNWAKQNRIMSPSYDAVQLSEVLAKTIQVKQ
ncbi:MAG: hypothetical protein KA797_01725 [Chitinophagales bacterium]|nr:hypothetical protein [Chitinophagales bacterium]